MKSRKAIMANTYQDYQRADKKCRGEILDRLVPVTGLNRDYLAEEAVPASHPTDAGHIAMTTANGLDFIVSLAFQLVNAHHL
jgi:hypothetical protein